MARQRRGAAVWRQRVPGPFGARRCGLPDSSARWFGFLVKAHPQARNPNRRDTAGAPALDRFRKVPDLRRFAWSKCIKIEIDDLSTCYFIRKFPYCCILRKQNRRKSGTLPKHAPRSAASHRDESGMVTMVRRRYGVGAATARLRRDGSDSWSKRARRPGIRTAGVSHGRRARPIPRLAPAPGPVPRAPRPPYAAPTIRYRRMSPSLKTVSKPGAPSRMPRRPVHAASS